MADSHSPDTDRLYYLPLQTVTVGRIDAPGMILDLGGGGEGIIGRLEGDRVMAIDRRIDELSEAPPGPHKIVMDMARLAVGEEQFTTVTAFFSLMYVREEEQLRTVLVEAYRVLKPGGNLLVWEGVLPTRLSEDHDTVVIQLDIQLPQETIRTGYGTTWPHRERTADYYRQWLEQTGFFCREVVSREATFYLHAVKAG